MISLFVLYQKPQNEETFLDYYRHHHVPLAKTMPGLLSLDWGFPRVVSDQADWYLVAEMRFQDREKMHAALNSSEGQAASRDVETFAAGLVTMRVVEWQ